MNEEKSILEELKKFGLPNLVFLQTCDADAQPLLEKIKNKWQSGEISNFDYLMKLNLLAGRTYNDLSQYPVFPWVISDYKSKQLNLDDPDVYRNLTSPIGALDKNRLQKLLSKRDANIDELDYLYGSFYSSPAVVIGYLIRVEPFTSLHIELQAGKFDVSNRLFNSIPKAWESVSKATMDFRELIPEFFFFPEFLRNINNIKNESVCDVELPKWANNSANEFVYLHRKALESKYVSSILNNWIDLIWGYKQRGENAIEADNVFKPSMYDDIWNDSDSFKENRSKIENVLLYRGQVPPQLFKEKHPVKSSKQAVTYFDKLYIISIESNRTEISFSHVEQNAAEHKYKITVVTVDGIMRSYTIDFSKLIKKSF